jgi:hypothetical protein
MLIDVLLIPKIRSLDSGTVGPLLHPAGPACEARDAGAMPLLMNCVCSFSGIWCAEAACVPRLSRIVR